MDDASRTPMLFLLASARRAQACAPAHYRPPVRQIYSPHSAGMQKASCQLVCHPLSSRIWTWGPLHRFLTSCRCHVHRLDYCEFGMHYKKPTIFCSDRSEFSVMSRHCARGHTHTRSASRHSQIDRRDSMENISSLCLPGTSCSRVRGRASEHLPVRRPRAPWEELHVSSLHARDVCASSRRRPWILQQTRQRDRLASSP